MEKNTIKTIALFLLALIELFSFYLASCETKFIPKEYWLTYAIYKFPLVVSFQLFLFSLMTSLTFDYKSSLNLKYGYYCFTMLQFISIVSIVCKIDFPFYIELVYEIFLTIIIASVILNFKKLLLNKF